MSEFKTGIALKYAGINHRGREALRRGEIQEYEGIPDDVKNRFNVSAFFSPESASVLQQNVIDKVDRVANENGIDLFLAGRDFPLHSTIQEGRLDGEYISQREMIFNELITNPVLTHAQEMLTGISLQYKYLLMDKGNIIFTSVAFPGTLPEVRQELSAVYTEGGLAPLPMTDILHITVGRMTKTPVGDGGDRFEHYINDMIQLRHKISSNPINLTVANCYVGPSIDLFSIDKNS